MSAESKKKSLDFEKSLLKLESIVRQLEEEQTPLETSLALFEEGQRLVKTCQEQLSAVENRIRILVENPQGDIEEQPFEVEPDEQQAPPDSNAGGQ